MKNPIKYIRVTPKVIKFLIADLYASIFRKKYEKRNIWIFGEKKTEARDNGYHFFKYIRENHPEIESYYVIKEGSPDEARIKEIGDTIKYDSFKHMVYYFTSKERVCSQVHGVRPYEEVSWLCKKMTFYRRKDQKQINLKHGISKDFRKSFDYQKVGFDLYIAGAKPEYDYIKENFNYPDKNIALTGFCRFDALHNVEKPEKMILVMPTFRFWLKTSDSSKEMASEEEKKAFIADSFYKEYEKLLTNRELMDKLSKDGYKVVFYLHYTFQPYSYIFRELIEKSNIDNVVIAGRGEYDVQDLLKRAAILVTDYSSVFFDFGYMQKPVIYFQFDLESYREKHYQEGYFSYENHGFGPVLKTNEEVVSYLENRIEDGLILEDIFLNRIREFFIPYDNQNCKRVYEAIKRLDT